MDVCSCSQLNVKSTKERKVLQIALVLNITMFVIGMISGLLAHSAGLIADSLDMLADASAYALALFAINRSLSFKKIAARISGILLAILGIGILGDVIYRTFLSIEVPFSGVMVGIASISLIVNGTVLFLIRKFRYNEIHLRATWIFTRADVLANLGVIISGILVAFTNSRFPDLIIGFAISLYVIKEAFEIFRNASK